MPTLLSASLSRCNSSDANIKALPSVWTAFITTSARCGMLRMESNRDMILVSPCIYCTCYFDLWFANCQLKFGKYPPTRKRATTHVLQQLCTSQVRERHDKSKCQKWLSFLGDPCLLVLFQFWIRMSQSSAILCDGLPNLMSCVPQMGCQNQGVTGLHPTLLFQYIHFQRLQNITTFKSQGSVSREAGSSITFSHMPIDDWIGGSRLKNYISNNNSNSSTVLLEILLRDSVRSHNIHLIHLTYVYLVFFPHPFPLTFAEDLPQSLGMIPGFISSLTS